MPILTAFGGAGGLHVCELADQLEVRRAVVPDSAGVLSAWGMLVAEPGRHLTRTVGQLLNGMTDDEVTDIVQQLSREAEEKLAREGHVQKQISRETSLELCYQGQAHTLRVDWTTIEDCLQAFAGLHQERYGHELQSPVELVNVRVGVKVADSLLLPVSANAPQISDDAGRFVTGMVERRALSPGQVVDGPISICDAGSTIWVAPGWQAERDDNGHLLLNKIIT